MPGGREGEGYLAWEGKEGYPVWGKEGYLAWGKGREGYLAWEDLPSSGVLQHSVVVPHSTVCWCGWNDGSWGLDPNFRKYKLVYQV